MGEQEGSRGKICQYEPEQVPSLVDPEEYPELAGNPGKAAYEEQDLPDCDQEQGEALGVLRDLADEGAGNEEHDQAEKEGGRLVGRRAASQDKAAQNPDLAGNPGG